MNSTYSAALKMGSLESPREINLPITASVSSSPSHRSLIPLIDAYVYLHSDHDMASPGDAVNSSRNGPEERRRRSESFLFVTDDEATDPPSPSNTHSNHTAGTSGGFFRRESRFSPLPAQEDSDPDAGELDNNNTG